MAKSANPCNLTAHHSSPVHSSRTFYLTLDSSLPFFIGFSFDYNPFSGISTPAVKNSLNPEQ
jgi:hypothetical protein